MENTSQNSSSKYRHTVVTSGFIGLGWAMLQAFLLYWYDTPPRLVLPDSFLSALMIALASFAIATSLHYYQPGRERYSYLFIWVISINTITLIILRFLLIWIVPDDGYIYLVDYSLPLRFIAGCLVIGWVAIMNVLWNSQQNRAEQEKRKTDAEKLAREAELYNLRQQLQPHFLFNSLNSIIALIGKKPEEARNMVFQLSDFLRGTLRKDDQQLISLREELDHLKLYLDIEKVRFGHRLHVDIMGNEDLMSLKLPAMILQPLLENSIKHGLYDTTGQVNIRIRATQTNHMLTIEVVNPYDEEHTIKKKSTGFGLRSVERRLFLLYGRSDLLRTNGENNTFTTEISIPQL